MRSRASTPVEASIWFTRTAESGVVDRDRVHSNRWGVAAAVGFGLQTGDALTFN